MKENKHSDNHAIAFRKDNANWMLVGTDGGLYETFDNGENWRFIDNMPITQFYKVAVDDASPFFTMYMEALRTTAPKEVPAGQTMHKAFRMQTGR